MKFSKSLAFKVAGVTAIGGTALGTTIFLNQRSKSEINNLKKLGFKVTNYNDSIWDKGFEKYEKYLNLMKNETEFKELPKNIEDLKNKCKEYSNLEESKLTEKDENLTLSPFQFVTKFCSWRTTLLNNLLGKGLKKLNTEENNAIWSEIANKTLEKRSEYQKVKKKDFQNNKLTEELWKEEIKEFCKNIDWNKEMIEFDEEPWEEANLCTNFIELQKVEI